VVVYERDDRPGGLLRYGIPEFKLEKSVLDRRLDQMRAEGTVFETGVEVGKDLPGDQLLAEVDALVLAGGATLPRDLPIPGRDLHGVHQAMEYLPLANRVQEGDLEDSPVSARGRRVVIIGGGDTGADCLGTAHRQGASSVHQLEIMPQPPGRRDPSTPWPLWPLQLRTSAAHEEGGERLWSGATQRFLGDGRGQLAGLVLAQVAMTTDGGRLAFTVVPETETELACDLVLLALGFTGPERSPMLAQLGVELDARGNVGRDAHWTTSREGVFVCGDMSRGQSLVVWAIAEGRNAAAAVDRWLMGETILRPSFVQAVRR
jgi:glutamate synthase (NADPH/NADH) small chain